MPRRRNGWSSNEPWSESRWCSQDARHYCRLWTLRGAHWSPHDEDNIIIIIIIIIVIIIIIIIIIIISWTAVQLFQEFIILLKE